MYWILAPERTNENEISFDGVPPLIEANDWNFEMGKIQLLPLPIPIIDFPYTIRSGNILTDNLMAPGCRGLVVHKNVRETFKDLNILNIYFYEISLINQENGKINDEYVIANIVGITDCVDYDKSDLSIDEDGDIDFINKFVFKFDDDKEYPDIFRLEPFFPLIIVKDYIKKAISVKYTGFMFYKPEDYS